MSRVKYRLACSLVLAAIVAAYANHFDNDFHFDDSHTIINTAYIVDRDGHSYENHGPAQQALAASRSFDLQGQYVTAPGAVDTTMLVFDLPKDVNEPYLKVRGEFLLGDVFDGNQYKRTLVRLF